jgi:hypothetical protein
MELKQPLLLNCSVMSINRFPLSSSFLSLKTSEQKDRKSRVDLNLVSNWTSLSWSLIMTWKDNRQDTAIHQYPSDFLPLPFSLKDSVCAGGGGVSRPPQSQWLLRRIHRTTNCYIYDYDLLQQKDTEQREKAHRVMSEGSQAQASWHLLQLGHTEDTLNSLQQ